MTGVPDRLTAALADRYLIQRELGAGGMATVYLAQDVKHDRQVAIKVLRPELAAALGAERFLAEVKITARLDHAHILTLIDSGNVDGALFYVMPYVEGESLRDRLSREKQLPIADAVRRMWGCCRLAVVLISDRNRSAPMTAASSGRSTLIATWRSCLRSWAR